LIPRRRLPALVLVAQLALGAPLAAQRDEEASQARPFSALSESARRLGDSLAARLGSAMAAGAAPIQPASAEHEALLRDSLLAIARSQLGTRYRLGAQNPGRAFDCSGFVRFVLSVLQLELPRTAATQALVGQPVERDTARLRPGDLLTFGRGRHVTHIGIYVGAGRFIHASSAGRSVIESLLSRGNWYSRHWLGARRVVATAEPAS
jgi:cell wall-associated NlpC family hydrolase